jgi:predicted ribosomally synthesized peptide with SipW-like signal peptide
MTNDRIQLTRRKILAGLGTAGVAGAGAGLGTNALFTDRETFGNNTLAAGELDLNVDWEEHYSYPQAYGFDDPTAGLDVTRLQPDDETAYVGLPDPSAPVVWVHQDDLADYMDSTAIEAFPDPDDDGSQEIETETFTYDPCEDGADLPEDMDPAKSGPASRTANADTQTEEGRKPLVSLDDVKPGDFGEFTLSFHLCDNPGHVWLQAANVSEAENGVSDSEAASESEDGTPESPGESPELAEQIRTAWWYDDGNNVIDSSVGEVDVMLAVDTSGSLTGSEVEALESDANDLASDLEATGSARVGGLSFGDTAVDDFEGLAGSPVQFSGLSPGGNTPTPAALQIAAAELDANARPDADTFIVLFTDGGPNYPPEPTFSSNGFTVGPFSGGATSPGATVSDSELRETAAVADAIREDHRILTVGINDDRKPSGREGDDPADIFGTGGDGYLSSYLRNEIAGSMADYFQAEDADAVSDILDAILAAIAMEEAVFQRGTLRGDLDLLADGEGLKLESSGPDDCFQPGVTYYIGFAWWLPASAGNEVQSDSVSFDLGFYTEQCRNNGTSGSS